jgi:hypothetical protein
MLKFVLRNKRRSMRQLEREKDVFIDRMTDELLVQARKFTPIDQGKARRGWRKEQSFRKTQVVNRVPYIVALEEGHSKQAPNGITTPAVRETLRRIR